MEGVKLRSEDEKKLFSKKRKRSCSFEVPVLKSTSSSSQETSGTIETLTDEENFWFGETSEIDPASDLFNPSGLSMSKLNLNS